MYWFLTSPLCLTPVLITSGLSPPLFPPTALVVSLQATCDEAAHSLVAAFLQRHQGELCDPAVATYVHGLLDCSTASEAIEVCSVYRYCGSDLGRETWNPFHRG